jgi:hypothetical protein
MTRIWDPAGTETGSGTVIALGSAEAATVLTRTQGELRRFLDSTENNLASVAEMNLTERVSQEISEGIVCRVDRAR